jgi:hypothetical protein
MIAGFSGSASWSRLDLIGKAILNLIAVAAFIQLGRTLSRSPQSESRFR